MYTKPFTSLLIYESRLILIIYNPKPNLIAKIIWKHYNY